MEPQNPSAKIARLVDTVEGGSVSIGLHLGLGPGPGPGLSHGKSGFTYLQLQELHHQALIFNYMATGVPVPSHLVLPIWKSFVSSSAGTQNYPNFMGYRGIFFDNRNSIEVEPGRCRRTDGKKWRCSKEVVQDQKYCERHMHRGRNRSRKHVEATSQIIASSSSSSSSNKINDTNTNLSISIPLQLTTTTTTTTTTTNSNSSTNVPPRLGFSPKSVLQSGICKKDSESPS